MPHGKLLTAADEDQYKNDLAQMMRLRLAREEVDQKSGPRMVAEQFVEGATAPIRSLGARAGAAIGLPSALDDPADVLRASGARQQAAYEQYPDGALGYGARMAMGAAQNLPGMAVSGAVGGLPGMIGYYSASAYDQAYSDAIDAGKSPSDARSHATKQAMVEGGVTAGMSAIGLGGVEKTILQSAKKQAVKQAMSKRLADFAAKDLTPEFIEESTIAVWQNFNTAADGIDPNADDFGNQLQSVADAVAQTTLTFGMIKGGQAAQRRMGPQPRAAEPTVDDQLDAEEARWRAEAEARDAANEEGDTASPEPEVQEPEMAPEPAPEPQPVPQPPESLPEPETPPAALPEPQTTPRTPEVDEDALAAAAELERDQEASDAPYEPTVGELEEELATTRPDAYEALQRRAAEGRYTPDAYEADLRETLAGDTASQVPEVANEPREAERQPPTAPEPEVAGATPEPREEGNSLVPKGDTASQAKEPEFETFPKESGTLGIPRADMPQVKSEQRGALANFLRSRGVEFERTEALPTDLKPSQAEFSPEKVRAARDHEGPERAILVSEDNHVIDGHHQWLQRRQDAPTEPIPVIRLGAKAEDVIPLVREFPSSETDDATSQEPAEKRMGPQPKEYLEIPGRTEAEKRQVVEILAKRVREFMDADPEGGDNPTVRFEFEQGVVYATLDDTGTAIRWAQGRGKKMGDLVDIKPMNEEDFAKLHPFFITGELSEDHPRRIRYEHRGKLKLMLPRQLKPLITKAKQLTQGKFIEQFGESESDIESSTGLDIKEFWRQVRNGPNDDRPLKEPVQDRRSELEAMTAAELRDMAPQGFKNRNKAGMIDAILATEPDAETRKAIKDVEDRSATQKEQMAKEAVSFPIGTKVKLNIPGEPEHGMEGHVSAINGDRLRTVTITKDGGKVQTTLSIAELSEVGDTASQVRHESALKRYPDKIEDPYVPGRMVDAPPIYLTGKSTDTTRAAAKDMKNLGVLVTPATAQYRNHLDDYEFFGVDNGAFSGKFDERAFYQLLDNIREAGHAEKAIFVAAPDVVCDWDATLKRSEPHFDRIRDAGFPVAVVLQNGATPDTVPWDRIDALFVGGDNSFKLGTLPDNPNKLDPNTEIIPLVREAKKRGVPIHFGRVNSAKRMEIVHYGLNGRSMDGTFLNFGKTDKQLEKVQSWLRPWGQFPGKTEASDTASQTEPRDGEPTVSPDARPDAPGATPEAETGETQGETQSPSRPAQQNDGLAPDVFPNHLPDFDGVTNIRAPGPKTGQEEIRSSIKFNESISEDTLRDLDLYMDERGYFRNSMRSGRRVINYVSRPKQKAPDDEAIPEFTRTTPESSSITRQDRENRIKETRDKIEEIRKRQAVKQKEHDGYRSNATRKRGAAKKEINFMQQRMNELAKSIQRDENQDALAKIEDELEKPRSYDHYLAGMLGRARLMDERRNEDMYLANLSNRAAAFARSLGLDESDANGAALAATNTFTIFDDRSLLDHVKRATDRIREARIAKPLGKLFPNPNVYGRQQSVLTEEQKQKFSDQLKQASKDDTDYVKKVDKIDYEIDQAIEAVRTAERKKQESEAKAKQAEADKNEREKLKNQRAKARKVSSDARIDKALKARKMKTEKVVARKNEDKLVQVVKGARKNGDQKAELHPSTGMMIHQTFDDDSKDYVVTHANTGLGAFRTSKKSDAKSFVAMMDVLGINLGQYKEKNKIPSDVMSRLTKVQMAWDNSDMSKMDEADQKAFESLSGAKPTDIDADMVLDADDLGATTDFMNNRGVKLVKDMAREVPEFSYDPVFTFQGGKLVFRDGYVFKFDPQVFNVHPSELKEGQTVGINLEDLGIKRKQPIDVVAEMLKNDGFSNVKKSKNGVVTAKWKDKEVNVGQDPDAKDNEWDITAFGDEARQKATAVLKKIRWRQPGQDGEAKTDIEGEPDQKTDDTVSQPKKRMGPQPKGKGGTSGGTHAQMMPEDAETGMTTDFEPGEASFDVPESEAKEKTRRIQAQPLPMPEMIQLVKSLMGDIPSVKRLRRYLGFVQAGEGGSARMVINALAAQDEQLLAKVLAHEAGHLIDWLPDKTFGRGNILGRIASLRKYLSSYMAGRPGGPGPLTDADRKRLKKEAKRVLQKNAVVEIEEEIVERFDITPQDILHIWNSVEEAANPDLMRYIKQLSAAEKLSLVKEAFRGIVPEEVQQFAKEVRRKTGRKIKQEVEQPASPKDVHDKYVELLKAEAEKRALLSNETIRNELIALTEWWTPFNRATSSQRYIKYRESSPELYAEALSVLFNSPMELAQRAPEFYRGFSAYLGEKPEVMDTFFDLQAVMNGGADKVSEVRKEIRRAMFMEGSQKIIAARAAREAARLNPLESARLFLSQYILDRTSPIKKMGKQFDSAQAKAAFYAADELAYSENRSYRMLRRIKEDVTDDLFDAGITEEDIGDYLFLRRVLNERNEIANPLGYTPSESGKELEQMRKSLGDEKFNLLEDRMEKWHDILFDSIEAAVDAGVYSRQAYEDTILPNKGNYATFAVIKYLEDNISPALRQQIGTFEGIANPWDATTMKMVSLNRLIELNIAKNATRDFMKKHMPGDITSQPIPYRRKEPVNPPRPGHDYLYILENGKLAAYEVADNIATSFTRTDIGKLAQFANVLQSGVYRVFHPLFVTFNPGFIVANPFRDLRRTWKNLASISGDWDKRLYDQLVRQGMAPAEARRQAKGQRITLGQVIKEYLKARKAAKQHLRSLEDPEIDRMIASKALSTPYVQVEAEIGETSEVERLMQSHQIKETSRKQRHKAIEMGNAVLEKIRNEGATQEIATKLAAWRLITDRMQKSAGTINPRERSHVVRRYSGTPDFKQKGLATPLTNSIWMYSNVKWQGLIADYEMATDPKTRAGWWWRTFTTDLFPTLVTKLALYGAFGVAVQAIMQAIGDSPDDDEEEYDPLGVQEKTRRIPTYFLDNYDVIPLGTVHDTSGASEEAQTLFLTIPKDESARSLSRLWSNLLDSAIELAGGDTRRGVPQKAWTEMFSASKEALVPSLSPPLDIAKKWTEFLSGHNPRDDFFGSDIVPPTEFEAGGWQATRKMIAWTEGKFGVAGQASHVITSPLLGEAFSPGDETVVERALDLPLGHHRFLRLSNRGMSEEEWLEVELQDREGAQFRSRLPKAAAYITKQVYRAGRIDDSNVSANGKIKNHLFKRWYYDTYLPTVREAKADPANEAKILKELGDSADKMIDYTNRFMNGETVDLKPIEGIYGREVEKLVPYERGQWRTGKGMPTEPSKPDEPRYKAPEKWENYEKLVESYPERKKVFAEERAEAREFVADYMDWLNKHRDSESVRAKINELQRSGDLRDIMSSRQPTRGKDSYADYRAKYNAWKQSRDAASELLQLRREKLSGNSNAEK